MVILWIEVEQVGVSLSKVSNEKLDWNEQTAY